MFKVRFLKNKTPLFGLLGSVYLIPKLMTHRINQIPPSINQTPSKTPPPFVDSPPQVHLGDTPHSLTEADFQALGAATEGFSGSDVSVVVKDVLMQPIRLLREATHFRKVGGVLGLNGLFGRGCCST
jgi:hypothetical protein